MIILSVQLTNIYIKLTLWQRKFNYSIIKKAEGVDFMKLTVLGPGCWGLTLAWLMNNNFEEIVVWGRESDLNEDLIVNKHCSKPLEV